MTRIISLIFILIGLAGCNSLTIPSKPRVLAPALNLLTSNVSQEILYIWLPPSAQSEFTRYVEAVDADAAIFMAGRSHANLHSSAQLAFTENVNNLGGLFNKTNGRLNQEILNQAISETSRALFSNYDKLTNILYITPFKESVQVIDGVVRWQQTEQKFFEHNAGSMQSKTAISLQLNYLGRGAAPAILIIGLDTKSANTADKGRYKNVIDFMLTPLLTPVN